jgi:hypothetical protein
VCSTLEIVIATSAGNLFLATARVLKSLIRNEDSHESLMLIREMISTATGQTDTTVVFYLILGTAIVITFLGISYVVWMIYTKYFKIDLLIQKDTLRFNKYPLLIRSTGLPHGMTNTSYAEITVHNNSKTKINECCLEIVLRRNKKDAYKSKVLSSDSTEGRNQITVSIDPEGDKGFHPLCLNLASFQVFLPNHYLGEAGAFTGTLVAHDEYDIFGRVLYDGKSGKALPLGKIKVPDDFINKAKIPNDVQVIIDQGGFAVYVEFFQGKVRAKFFGRFTDGDVKRTLKTLNELKFQVDTTIEDNGKLRKIDEDRPAWVFG